MLQFFLMYSFLRVSFHMYSSVYMTREMWNLYDCVIHEIKILNFYIWERWLGTCFEKYCNVENHIANHFFCWMYYFLCVCFHIHSSVYATREMWNIYDCVIHEIKILNVYICDWWWGTWYIYFRTRYLIASSVMPT